MMKNHLVQVHLQWKNILQPKSIIIISIIITECTNDHFNIMWFELHDFKTNWKLWWKRLFLMVVFLYMQTFMKKFPLKLIFFSLFNCSIVPTLLQIKNVLHLILNWSFVHQFHNIVVDWDVKHHWLHIFITIFFPNI